METESARTATSSTYRHAPARHWDWTLLSCIWSASALPYPSEDFLTCSPRILFEAIGRAWASNREERTPRILLLLLRRGRDSDRLGYPPPTAAELAHGASPNRAPVETVLRTGERVLTSCPTAQSRPAACAHLLVRAFAEPCRSTTSLLSTWRRISRGRTTATTRVCCAVRPATARRGCRSTARAVSLTPIRPLAHSPAARSSTTPEIYLRAVDLQTTTSPARSRRAGPALIGVVDPSSFICWPRNGLITSSRVSPTTRCTSAPTRAATAWPFRSPSTSRRACCPSAAW